MPAGRVLLCFAAASLLFGCGKSKAPATHDTVSADALGLPLYPSSTEWGTGSSLLPYGNVTKAASARQTTDAPDKVVTFYKGKLKNAKVVADGSGDLVHTSVTGLTRGGESAEVVVMKLPRDQTRIFVSVDRKKK